MEEQKEVKVEEKPIEKELPKEEKTEVIPEPQKVVVEIDYDKLADVIKNANLKASILQADAIKEYNDAYNKKLKKQQSQVADEKIPFKKKVKFLIDILRGKVEENDDAESLVNITAIVSLDGIAGIIRFVSLMLFIGVIVHAIVFDWNGANIVTGILSLIAELALIILMIIYAGIFKMISKTLKKERDRNYVIAVFSALSGFVALIIALVALLVNMVG